MLNFFVAAIGFSCVTPGIAVATLGGIGIQPALLLFAVYCFVFPLSLCISLQPMLWMLANVAGFILSSALAAPSSAGAGYAALQSVYYGAAGFGFSTILSLPRHRRALVNGYVAAALVSSVVGIVQAIFTEATGLALVLANNENFSLAGQIGRAVAFTPEASVLASLLLPAFFCVWFDRGGRDSALAAPLRGRFALALLLAGLVATRSTTLLAAPAVLLATAAFLERDWRAFLAASGRIVAVVAIAGLPFLTLYQARIGITDEAGWSRTWRELKIDAGLRIFEDNPVLGAGIGYVSDPARFSPHLVVPRHMAWLRDNTLKGVDSTPVRILAEGGTLGLLLAYYPILAFWRKARVLAASPEWRSVFSLCLPLLVAQTITLGYRDLFIMLLPSVAFAVAGDVVLGAARRARTEHHESVVRVVDSRPC